MRQIRVTSTNPMHYGMLLLDPFVDMVVPSGTTLSPCLVDRSSLNGI
jgi:hypothetical protein